MIKSEYKSEKSTIKCQSDRLIDILELSQNPEYQDVTIICDNGRLNVNSFLLASVFPVLRKLNYSEWGELIFITLRGLDCNDLQRVLDSIYQQEAKISLPSSIHKLMENVSNSVNIHEEYETDTIKNDLDDYDDDYEPEIQIESENRNQKMSIDLLYPIVKEELSNDDGMPKKKLKKKNLKVRENKLKIKIEKTKVKKERKKKKGIENPCLLFCHVCGTYSTKRKYNLERHIQEVHSDMNGYIKCKKCKLKILESELGKHSCVLYPCDICGKEFGKESYLRTHIESIHEKTHTCTCDVCGKVFLSKATLSQHVKYQHEPVKTIPCTICGKEYTDRDMKTHLLTHQEKVECTICNVKVRKIEFHMKRMHASDEDKRYRCNVCGKGFVESQALNNHQMNVHLKLRPYKCRYGCTFAYNDSSNRNAHERKTHGKLFETKKKER